MKSLKFSIFTLFLIFSSTLVLAQEQKKLSLNDGTIDNQFEFIIKSSNRYQEFKVVKATWLNTLRAHTSDSLKALQNKLDNTNTTINTQQKEIDELKTNLTKTQDTLIATNTEKDSMALFGLQMSKIGYNMLMWAIIAGLLVFLMIFIFKFKNSNSVTKNAKKALSEVENEFEEHRRNALEREQKVRRQLQDELNKQKG